MGFFLDGLKAVCEATGISDAVRHAQYRHLASSAAKNVDMASMIKELDDRTDDYMRALRNELERSINGSSTQTLLEMTLYTKTKILGYELKTFQYSTRPDLKIDGGKWTGCFTQYMFRKVPEDEEIVAGVEVVVEKAINKATQEYFSSQEVCKVLQQGMIYQMRHNKAVQTIVTKELKESGKLIKKEVSDTVAIQGHAVAADTVHDSLVSVTHTIGTTAFGKILTKVLALPAVKVMLVKVAATAIGAEIIHLIAAKFGLVAIGVVIFGSGFAAVAPFLLPVILPGLLLKAWFDLPEKLAESLPKEILPKIREQAPKTNRKVVNDFVHSSLEKLFEEIHEGLMEGLEDD